MMIKVRCGVIPAKFGQHNIRLMDNHILFQAGQTFPRRIAADPGVDDAHVPTGGTQPLFDHVRPARIRFRTFGYRLRDRIAKGDNGCWFMRIRHKSSLRIDRTNYSSGGLASIRKMAAPSPINTNKNAAK